MDEKLKKRLIEIQSQQTFWGVHNQQFMATQVEAIFMLDKLSDKITRLNETLEDSAYKH